MEGKNMRGNHSRTPQQKMEIGEANWETTTSATAEQHKTEQVCQAGQGERGDEARVKWKSLSNLC